MLPSGLLIQVWFQSSRWHTTVISLLNLSFLSFELGGQFWLALMSSYSLLFRFILQGNVVSFFGHIFSCIILWEGFIYGNLPKIFCTKSVKRLM